MTSANPYENAGAGDDAITYVMPNSRYAAPNANTDAPYTDSFGWAPKLAQTVDPARMQETPLRDYRPDATRPPQEWYGRLDADEARRHSVESQDADGWERRRVREVRAPDPRWTPADDTPRSTSKLSPSSYSFTRPFGENFLGIAKRFNGLMFSMASHRRTYEVMGMAPARSLRNTYRLDPPPWDADIRDEAPNLEPTTVPGSVRAVEVPPSSARTNRTWRL